MDEEDARQQALIKEQEIKILKKEFFDFVSENKEDLDSQSIFTMLQSHGKVKECIEFATSTGSHKELIVHYLNNKEFEQAIRNLQYIEDKKLRCDQMNNYASILLKNIPRETL